MGVFDYLSLQHFPRQLARKQNVFDQNGEATLTGLLNYGQGREAKGGLIYGRKGHQDKLIATTAKTKSSYQGMRKPGDADVEVGRVSNPLNKTVNDLAAAFPNDHKLLAAVELFKSSRNGHQQLLDTPELYAALKVLAPYEEKLKQARESGTEPKAVRFAEKAIELSPPKPRKPRKHALVRQKTAARARKAIPSAPASTAANTVQVNAKAAEPKLDLREAVRPNPTETFTRGDLRDAQLLLVTCFKYPEFATDPLRMLLILAQEHAAQRTLAIPNHWDMANVTGIDDGLKILLKTPVLHLLKLQAPKLFEAVCSRYDELH